MLERLKFAKRMIQANPRPYVVIATVAAGMNVALALYLSKQTIGENKYTLHLTKEMYDLLLASEGPIYFETPDMTLRLHFDH